MPSGGVSPATTSCSAGMRPRLAVDPEAVLDRRAGRRGSGTARPRRAAGARRPGRRRSRSTSTAGREVEADRERHRLGAPAAAGRDQPVLAGELAAVGGEVEPALVDQAEAADIAVVARLDPADPGGLVARPARPRRRPCRASRRRGSRSNCGRPGSGSNGRRVRAQRVDQPGRQRALRFAGAAAIDDQPVRPVAELEGQGRGAGAVRARAAAAAARRRTPASSLLACSR